MAGPRVDRRTFIATVSSGIAAAAVTGGVDAVAQAAQSKQSGSSDWNTGLVSDERYLDHLLSPAHPESPERLVTISAYVDQTGLNAQLVPLTEEIPAQEHVLRVHSESHYASVKACPVTGAVAELAVSQVLGAAKAVCDGAVRNAFCAVRPPGHHSHNYGASYDGNCQGEGFCFFNNVAVAARYVQQVLGYERVLIIDWDYHFGNGTNWVVKADPSVMFYSTHNLYAYPGTGDPAFTGEGDAVGHTVNVHLNAGSLDENIVQAWDGVFAPRMKHIGFEPDFVLISAGFDSRIGDTLGSFRITDAGFVALTRKAMAIADEYCGGRLLSVLEGGYNVDGLARAVCAHTATLAGLDWNAYVPPLRKKPRQEKSPAKKPEVRQGMLYMPEPEAESVERVVVFDASGRAVYQVPQEELGRTVVDLWPRALTAGMFTVVVRMKDGSILRMPYGAGGSESR